MSRPKPAYSIEVRSPFPPPSYYMLYDWSMPVWKYVCSDDAPTDREGFIQKQLELAEMPGAQTWGVWRDGELGGFISATRHPERPWIAQLHTTFKKEFWGAPTTTVACRRVFQELFAAGVLKAEMWAFVDNHAVMGLIDQLGGHREGKLTAQVMRGGVPVDIAVYGLYQESLRLE